MAGTEIGTIGIGTILVASTGVKCTLINIYNYDENMYLNHNVHEKRREQLSISNIQTLLTNTDAIIILDLITRIAGTEIGTIGVCTILVASTDVMYTLVNVYK